MARQAVVLLLLSCVVQSFAFSNQCPVNRFLNAPDCSRILVHTECSSTKQCPEGQTCCPGACGSTRCTTTLCTLRKCLECSIGNKLDKYGCRECGCKDFSDQCPVNIHPVDCAMFRTYMACSRVKQCPQGETCCPSACGSTRCISKLCPALKCSECINGNVLDENGCKTCRCIEYSNTCPAVTYTTGPDCTKTLVHRECGLTKKCPKGKTCCPGKCGSTRCTDELCPLLRCKACIHGDVLNEKGCRTCQCMEYSKRCPVINYIREPDCSNIIVKRQCTPKYGCPKGRTCCPGVCGSTACTEIKCSPVRCRMYCRHGWAKDDNGCDVCKCKIVPPTWQCPKVKYFDGIKCPMMKIRNECSSRKRCPRGYTCCPGICGSNRCVKTMHICPMIACPIMLGGVGGICQNGYEKDRHGCQTCRCKARFDPRCPMIKQYSSRYCILRRIKSQKRCSSRHGCRAGRTCCPGPCGSTRCLKLKPRFNPLCPNPRFRPLSRLSCKIQGWSRRYRKKCSITGKCPAGQMCCPWRCGSTRCLPKPRFHPQCPRVSFNRRSCRRRGLRHRYRKQCSTSHRCPAGKMCCPGRCGSTRCLKLKLICPLMDCTINMGAGGEVCRNGYEKEKNGCPSCRCKGSFGRCPVSPISDMKCSLTRPASQCSSKIHCPVGQTCCQDRCGSTTCVSSKPICPQIDCPVPLGGVVKTCHHGYEKDKNGCPTCKCKEPFPDLCPDYKSQSMICGVLPFKDKCSTSSQCSQGLTCCPGVCGAKICMKLKHECLTFLCPPGQKCPLGFQKDKYGCPTCRCIKCLQMKCSRKCKDGYYIDDNGCPTCRCIDINSSPCPHNSNDKPGYCMFKPVAKECSPIKPSCPSGKACCVGRCGVTRCLRYKAECLAYPCAPPRGGGCQHGHEVDNDGCPTCSCRRVPCPCGSKCCKKACRWGFVRDASGCELCECKSRPKDVPEDF